MLDVNMTRMALLLTNVYDNTGLGSNGPFTVFNTEVQQFCPVLNL